jgi:hypothetical protein
VSTPSVWTMARGVRGDPAGMTCRRATRSVGQVGHEAAGPLQQRPPTDCLVLTPLPRLGSVPGGGRRHRAGFASSELVARRGRRTLPPRRGNTTTCAIANWDEAKEPA